MHFFYIPFLTSQILAFWKRLVKLEKQDVH
jgi:hypothetical protein